MKTELRRRLSVSFLMGITFLAVLLCQQPAFGAVSVLGSWVQGTTHAKETGNDRVLVFIGHGELNNNDMNLQSVAYGGQPMTKVLEFNYRGTSTSRNYTAVYILKEPGIVAASNNNFGVSWRNTPTATGYASVFLQNANQIDTLGATATAGVTGLTGSTSALNTNAGDMVILGATYSNSGAFATNNGFTEGIDQNMSSLAQGVTGHKASAGPSETPSVTFTGTSGRVTLVGLVIQRTIDPHYASNPNPANNAANVGIKTNLGWDAAEDATSYDVYFGTNPVVRNNPKYTVTTNSFDPPVDLEYGTNYYWAVDAIGSETYTGPDWTFKTFIVADRVTGNMVLLNDNGGWCWYQDEKIAYDPTGCNVLISTAAEEHGFGGVGGARLDDVDTTTLNINTGKRTRVIAKDAYGGDDHNMGAFWIRPDGRYLHIFCSHYNDPELTRLRLSTRPNDGSEWGAEWSYNWETISGLTDSQDLSYTNVQYLSGEGTGMGRLYNIVRVNTRTPCISYSDDWGQTWQYMGRLNSPAGGATYSNFYHKFQGNGVDRIYFIGNENHPRNNNNGCYAGYIQNGKSYNSYGVEIDSTLFDMTAPTIQAFTPIFIPASDQNQEDAYHTGWVNELELDRDGNPVCLYQTRHGPEKWGNGSTTTFDQQNSGAADHRFFYARFDGTSWTSTELAHMGTGLHLPEQDYIGMGCINPDDVNEIYIGTSFDPRDDANLGRYRELFRGNTTDNGLTWNWTQITFNSTQDNVRPAIPKWDVNNSAVVWTRGTWGQNNYEDYDLVVVGMVKEQHKSLELTNYFDANQSNTTNADGSSFTPTGPSGSAGAADNQWHAYTGYGNSGSVYTAGDSGAENAPAIKTTVSGVADGTYDVFAYFWANTTQDWGVRGGFELSDANMLCFSRQSSQFAEPSQFTTEVETEDDSDPILLYRAYIGRQTVSGGSSVTVYIDDYDNSYNSNAPTRTTYDGIGLAKVLNCSIAGDLNCNGKVDLQDFVKLGDQWQTTYDIDTLADMAENWLFGTE